MSPSARYLFFQTVRRFSLKCVYKGLFGCFQKSQIIKIGVSYNVVKKVAVLSLPQNVCAGKGLQASKAAQMCDSRRNYVEMPGKINVPRLCKKSDAIPNFTRICRKKNLKKWL